MMKKYFSFIAVCALLFALALTAYAETESDDYGKAFENELFSAFDSETKAAMELFGIESLDDAGAFDFSLDSLSDYFKTNLKEKANAALRFFFELLSVLMVVSLIATLGEKNERSSLVGLISVCVFSVLVAQKTASVLNIAVMMTDAVNKLLFSYVPVYAGIIAVSGSPVSAAAYNSLTLLFAEGVSLLTAKLVVPFTGVILCLSIAFSMNGQVNCSRFLSAAGKCANFVLGSAAAFFTGFLTLKSILSSAADSAASRGIRFIVSGLIPVVGSAMSEAYSAFASSINLIKGSAAVIGIAAVFVTCFPAITELFLYFAAVSVLSFASQLLGQNEISSLFKGFSLALKILLLVSVYGLFIFVISTGLMLSVKGGS